MVQSGQLKVSLSTTAIVNLKGHRIKQELKRLYRSEKDARLFTWRLHAVYLAAKELSYPQILTITGAARRTIQQSGYVSTTNRESTDKKTIRVPGSRLNCLAGTVSG